MPLRHKADRCRSRDMNAAGKKSPSCLTAALCRWHWMGNLGMVVWSVQCVIAGLHHHESVALCWVWHTAPRVRAGVIIIGFLWCLTGNQKNEPNIVGCRRKYLRSENNPLTAKCDKGCCSLKNYHSSLDPKASDYFFCPTNNQKLKGISFTIMNDKGKQRILTFRHLESLDVWHFCFKIEWNELIIKLGGTFFFFFFPPSSTGSSLVHQ